MTKRVITPRADMGAIATATLGTVFVLIGGFVGGVTAMGIANETGGPPFLLAIPISVGLFGAGFAVLTGPANVHAYTPGIVSTLLILATTGFAGGLGDDALWMAIFVPVPWIAGVYLVRALRIRRMRASKAAIVSADRKR